MRSLTEVGWQRINQGFDGLAPLGNEQNLWEWAMTQGSGFQLAAYLIIGMLGGSEDECPGFNRIKADAHPVRFAWSLDSIRRGMISDFLADPFRYIKTNSIRFENLCRAADLAEEKRRKGLK